MKIVINSREYGRFGLSALATQEYAKRKGKDCYFFKHERFDSCKLVPLTLEEAQAEKTYWFASTVPNPQDYKNDEYREIYLAEGDEIPRDDPDLIATIEELGQDANGKVANLKIVDIPDDVEWTVEEYDEAERVVEVHRTWS